MIGRRVGPMIVPEPTCSQRVDGDVVVFLKPENEPLRTCILRVSDMRPQTDEPDGLAGGRGRGGPGLSPSYSPDTPGGAIPPPGCRAGQPLVTKATTA